MLKYKMFNSIFLMSLMVVFLSSEVHTYPQAEEEPIQAEVVQEPIQAEAEAEAEEEIAFVAEPSPTSELGIHRNGPVIISEFYGVTCSAVAGEGQSDTELSTCLSDTGRKISEAEVANLSKFAVADEPSGNDSDDPLERFFAMVTKKLRDIIEKDHLDPDALPNAHVQFSKHVGPITLHGDATADNGSFKGLATINITGKPTRDDEYWVNGIQLSATFKELKGRYDLEASFMAIKIKGSVTIEDKDPTLSISASLDRTACRLHVREILTDIGDISLTVCGLGPLDWILNHVVGRVGVVVKAFIEGLGDKLKGLIDKFLNDVDLSKFRRLFGCDVHELTFLHQTEMINPTTLSL